MENSPEIKKSSKTEHHYTDREKNDTLRDYETYVSEQLTMASELKEELKQYEELRRQKDESFDFEKWNKLKFELQQRERNINAHADSIDTKFDMKVERPNFNEELSNHHSDDQEREAA